MRSQEFLHILALQRQETPAVDLQNRTAFLSNLVYLWHVIRASERLLEVAIEHSSDSLRKYFLDHLEEERGHAKWLAEDLATADIAMRRTDFLPLAAEMVGIIYYFVQHIDPAALLGYMLALEGLPMPLSQIEKLEATHGKELLRTLRYHAEHDIDHGAALSETIDALPEETRDIVFHAALLTNQHLLKAASFLHRCENG